MDFLITSSNSASANELKRRCVRTPETPVPLLASCSSGISSDEHCSNIQADGGGLKLQLRRIHRLNSLDNAPGQFGASFQEMRRSCAAFELI